MITSTLKMGWAEHWSNGGTGITKTSDTTAEIAESVALFGDNKIFMQGTELHCSRENCDISDFWAFHNARTYKEVPSLHSMVSVKSGDELYILTKMGGTPVTGYGGVYLGANFPSLELTLAARHKIKAMRVYTRPGIRGKICHVAHLATLNAKEEGWCLDKALAEHVEEYKQDNTAKNFADVLWLSEAVEVNAGTSLYYAHVLSQHDASAAVPLTEEQEEFNRQIEARLDELVARLLSTGSLLRKTAEPCDTAEEVEEEEDTQDHEQLCEGGDHCGILHSHPSGYCDLCRMDQQK